MTGQSEKSEHISAHSLTPSLPHSLIRQAAAAIQASRRIVIATHVNPDGDALGSLCALALACERLDKQTARVSVDGVPAMYAGLPSVDRVLTAVPSGSFDLGIGVDNVLHTEKTKLRVRLSVINVTNKEALYNFLSTFSGTHFVTPRAYQVQLGVTF